MQYQNDVALCENPSFSFTYISKPNSNSFLQTIVLLKSSVSAIEGL